MTPDRIAELRRLCEEASRSPWRVKRDESYYYQDQDGARELLDGDEKSLMGDPQYYPWAPDREEDWQFIAAAREAVPELLDEVERLEFERSTLENAVESWMVATEGWKRRAEDLRAENERLREALEEIADGDDDPEASWKAREALRGNGGAK